MSTATGYAGVGAGHQRADSAVVDSAGTADIDVYTVSPQHFVESRDFGFGLVAFIDGTLPQLIERKDFLLEVLDVLLLSFAMSPVGMMSYFEPVIADNAGLTSVPGDSFPAVWSEQACCPALGPAAFVADHLHFLSRVTMREECSIYPWFAWMQDSSL